MSNYYNTSFSKTGILLLPTFLRKPIIVAIITAMMRLQDNQQTSFLSYINSIDTEVYTQVCYMQGIINDNFDYYERRIKVRTVKPDFDGLITWDRSINRRLLIGTRGSDEYKPLLLNAQGQIGRNNPSFEVAFPKGFTLSENEMDRVKSLINQCKLASKNYRIVYE